jgi:hypothetical protein
VVSEKYLQKAVVRAEAEMALGLGRHLKALFRSACSSRNEQHTDCPNARDGAEGIGSSITLLLDTDELGKVQSISFQRSAGTALDRPPQ